MQIQEKQVCKHVILKIIEHLHHQKILFFVCLYKMFLISAEGYKNAVHFLKVRKTGKIWASMKDSGSGMGVKNISDLVLKEIYGICETKHPTKKQINNYKMTEREIYEKFSNLSEDELNKKSNKNIYVRNNVMTTVIKCCRGEKKEA